MTSFLRKLITAILVAAAFASSAGAIESVVVKGLFKNTAVLSIDGKRRVLRAGSTSPEGVKLISATSKEAILEFDGEQKSYTLGTEIRSTFAAPAEKASIRIWPTELGMYAVRGSINGYPVKFLVDTGATLIAMNRREARRLGLNFRLDGEPGLSSTASGVVKTYRVTLKAVKVGQITLSNVRAAVIDGDYPEHVLLGNSFLNRLEMQRDGQVMVLRKKF